MKEKEYYKRKICELLEKIEDVGFLKRIYQLAEYLYVHGREE